ncbi:unnamed protein product [Arabidopsis thaliana]|uniref:Nucleoporin-like protein n=1 Tax=Arabidopsis thaliana TaxID=3702 RepID=A0A5S9Y5U5_ARATH|nr:unnamed protein product [Arabidopsis thaliana]VYS67423.1 unnamed protein product [Arabidopsis thaliana]
MATQGEATFSAAATTTSSYPTGGVGGKLKRQSARRHAATPYSRPTQNQVQRRPWISRIVDPAYRIISGGATRILPYFFSNAASAPALTAPPEDQDQHQGELQNDPQDNDPSVTPILNKPDSASVEVGGPSGTANVDEGNFSISAQRRGKAALNDAVAISELERLMEGKTFSQAEIDRLIETINSRAVDLPNVKRDEKNLEIPLREGTKKNMSLFDKAKEPIGGKDANSELWATPTPLAKSIIFDGDKQIRDEVGLSPAELAKAYMGGQTSSSSSQGFVARNEKDCLDRSMLVGKSSLASPSSKPSACWPGIKSSEQSGFATPQSRRESYGLQNFPRTPYSRTILSNSKSKLMQLQNDSSKRLSNLQSPSQSVEIRYGQLSKGRDGGLFGPSRRTRQSATPSMVSPYSRPSRGASRFENSAIMKSSEAGESSYLSRSQITTYVKHKESEVGTPTVPTHSSQIARTILDHLERTQSQSTPKNKTAELKLATSWRHPQSSKTVEKSSSDVTNVKKDGSAKLHEDIQNIFSQNQPSSVLKPPATTTGDIQNGMNKTASASNGIFSGTQAVNSSGTALQYEFGKPKDSLSRSMHDELGTSSQDAAKAVPYSFGGETANLPKPPSHSLGNNKPVLPSISVAKPFQKWAVPSGSNAGFTFPVSSSDGTTSSEPTTPSIMPFTTSPPVASGGGVAITNHHEARKDDEIPQFSFDGSNRRGDKSPLVFSFPSVSEEVVNEDDDARLGIKYTFGSEKPERISFSSAGSDGVCC